jgi:hypothetical protein
VNISGQRERVVETTEFRKEGYAILCELSVNCLLTKTDRRTLADHIQHADRIGTGVHVMLARLLGQKLLYAPVVEDDKIGASIAASGSRVTYAIDELEARSGRLRHDDGHGLGQSGIPVATLLGATLIGMKAGARAPFLQADGSFRTVSLLDVSC